MNYSDEISAQYGAYTLYRLSHFSLSVVFISLLW